MTYTEAVLLEILRIASPVPATVRCNAYDNMHLRNTKLPAVKTNFEFFGPPAAANICVILLPLVIVGGILNIGNNVCHKSIRPTP